MKLETCAARALEGKVVLVTGAAGGIGSAAVRGFVAAGALVVALDQDRERLATACPAAALQERLDVTDPGAVEGVFAAVEARFDRVDCLFNGVGISGRRFGDGPVDTCAPEAWDRVLETNLRSVFLTCRAVIPAMRRAGGGSIVNLASVLGLVGHELFDTHAYAASKGAVIALTRAMAVRYAREHIRVNVLCPGLIRTPMSLRAQSDPTILGMLPELQPLTGDFGDADDVASAALYLLSDAARFVTGVVLPVDGGWTAR